MRQKVVFFAVRATIVARKSEKWSIEAKFDLFGDNGNKADASGGQPIYVIVGSRSLLLLILIHLRRRR